MNNTSEYIDAMPLTDIEKAALPKSDIRAVHTALDGEHRQFSRDDDTGSVKARLEQAWPDSLAEGQLIKDDEGRDQLQAMPKARVPLCSPIRGAPTRWAASGIACAGVM
jgi:membrane glycosyltransferase